MQCLQGWVVKTHPLQVYRITLHPRGYEVMQLMQFGRLRPLRLGVFGHQSVPFCLRAFWPLSVISQRPRSFLMSFSRCSRARVRCALVLLGFPLFAYQPRLAANSAKEAPGLPASACNAKSSSHRDALVISSCAVSDRYSAIMVGISRPLVSLSSSCVTDRSKKLTGAKSGPRSLVCQCSSTAMSSLVTVRLPSISATYEPPPRGCRLSSPAFFGGWHKTSTHGPPGRSVRSRSRFAWTACCLLLFSSSPSKKAALESTMMKSTPPSSWTSRRTCSKASDTFKTPSVQ